ncbi:MAG: hypothetical protein J5606_10390 [Bacteroidales bacterium]|nr:hypothetical protein [Bacteroidales bacterium]
MYVSGGAFMVSQKNQFKPLAEFRPSIQIQYNRILWKGLGISAGYAFKRANPNEKEYIDTKTATIEETHAIIVAPNYRFEITNFNITPYFAMGVCFANFTFLKQAYNVDTRLYYYYKTKTYTCFMISQGIRLGYDINRWTIFMSYNYDYYRCKVKEPPFHFNRVGIWYFPEGLGHHCWHIGAGIKF